MKPMFLKLTAEPEEGFVFKRLCAAGFDCPWHVHPEYELILVQQSNGYRIVGDNIAPLRAGDLVFVGPGLPHIWQHEPAPKDDGGVRALLIQFEERFLGDSLLWLPVFEPIRRLFKRTARGLCITGKTRDAVAEKMAAMDGPAGIERIVQLLRIFELLAHSEECTPLASVSFALEAESCDQERMNRVFQFLNARLAQAIRLPDAARAIGLSEGAFSRFFRAHTGKSFPEFLNEVRVGRACRMLIESDRSITEIGYECGFANLSNFNRQFLRLKKASPREYRRQMQFRIPGFK